MEENNKTNNESRKWLYDKFVAKGINVGKDYDEFDSLLTNNNESRKWAYDKACSLGYNVGKDYDEFNSIIGMSDIAIPTESITSESEKKQEDQPAQVIDSIQPADPVEDVKQDYTPKYAPHTEEVKKIDMITEQEPEYATGLKQGWKQGWKGLGHGLQHLGGEALNLFTGSTIDEEKALARIAELEKSGIDVESNITPLDKVQRQVYETMLSNGETQLSGVTDEDKRHARLALEDDAINKTIRKYIEKAGSLEEAKAMLAQRADEETQGDKWIKRATQGLAELKPTKGFGAWVGNLLPQMVPAAASMAVGAATKSPTATKVVGGFGLATMTASTAGMSMNEAREAGATGLQTWAVGIADGAIEFLTEKIPFNRYTSRVLSGVKKDVGNELAEAVTNSPQARNELERLLQEANKRLGGKLFNGKNAKDFAGDIVAEGLSEFTAEALQTITPMIYENPEDYPTIGEILRNGWEGAKAGVFMGSVLGGASKTMEHYQQKNRRKEQGFVDVVEFETEGEHKIGEALGMDDKGVAVLTDGEVQYVIPEDIIYGHRFTFDEFDRAELQMESDESYDNGYSLQDPQEMNDANNNYLYHRENMVRTFGLTDESDIDAFLGDNPIETVARRRQAGASTEETQTIIDYINAKATYDGMLQSVRDDIDGRIEQSNARIDSYVNRSTGNIHGAVLKQDDRLVYIVNGNAVAFDDGVIDTRNSSNTIIVKDAETGELKQISPSDLLTLYDVQDPNEQKEISAQQIRNGVADESLNKINGVVDFNDKAQFLNEVANQIAITMILAQRGLDADYIKTFLGNAQIVENPDGTLTFTDGQNEVVVPKQEIQQQVDANNMQRVADFNNQVNGTRKNINNTSSTEEKNVSLQTQQEQQDEVSQRISQNNDRTQDARNRRMEEASARLRSSSEAFIRAGGRSQSEISESEVKEAESYAKENGLWIPFNDVFNLGNPGKGGNENETYFSPEGYVYKVNNLMNSGDIASLLERLLLHNQIFPETAYELVGFTGFEGRSVYPIVKQKTIESPANATTEEIEAYMTSLGFTKISETEYTNNEVVVSDLHPRNVLKSESGNIYVVDAEFKRTKSSLIPKDESGNPIYEQADSETAWDALMEDAEGDEMMAGEVAKSMIADKEAELKKLEKSKIKDGKTPAEKMAALKERKAEVEKIKQDIEAWKKIAAVPMQRQIAQQERIRQEEAEAAAKRKADEERLLAERKEAERKEQELLNGIPDYSEDTPQNARARGYRRVNGHIEERQQPIEAVQGKETEVEFSNDVRPKGHYAVIDASQLQASHIQGNRNPLHFLDEAQPKERNDKASIVSAQKIAGNIRPATITTGETAYVGTPTVNTRGEVIQGNSRSDALKLMYGSHNDQAQTYKQYLINNAEQFGLNPEDVSNMESPVLVRMLDVSDEQAITLGQYVAQDTESGGVERIKSKNAVKKMGDDINSFANMLLDSADEDASFAELLDTNGVRVLKWMAQKGYITDTQYSSAFDTKGSLTAEAKNDLRGIMYQSIFEGGNTRLEEMFNALPAKAQKAILATAHRDFNSPNSERMIEEIQNSIRAFYALMQDEQFAKAKNFKDATKAVEAWQKQYQMDDVTGESYLPSEKFTNFALHLAKMYKGEKQSNIQSTFEELYDLIQGTKEDNLFEQADNTPRTLVQAIKEVLNIDYNGQRRSIILDSDIAPGQQGQHGRTGDVASRERTESGEQSANDSGRTDEDSGSSAFETNRQTENESGDIRTAQTVHQSRSEREGLEQDLDGRRQTDGTGMADDAAGIMETRNDRSDIRVFEEGLDASYNEYSEHSERTRRAAESERLVSLAKLHGMFVPSEVIKTLTGKHPKRTGESFVYIDKEAGKVTKVKDPYAKAAIKSGVQPEDAAFEYLVHNLIFPETAYTFEGISEDMGDVRIVLSQSFIQSKGHPTKEQIAEALAERGLFPEDKYSFGNEFVSVTDVEGDNVILGEDGNLYFIDPIIRFKKPLKEILDNYNRNNNSTLGEQIKSAEKEVNTSPTDKQKEAGNYKKGHVQIGTFNITIEQPKGSVRSGVDANGRKWETTMHNTYGYIRGTEGVDGDHIDVFLSDDIDGWNGNNVFVVDQYNEDGTFDEHKVMLGFNTIEEAESAYLDNYEKGWEKKHKIVVSPIHTENFEKWIESSHRKTKPFAEYKSVKSEENRTKNNENRTKSTENSSKVEENSVKDESQNKTIVEQSKKPSSKIEDFGEKIGGARKDVIRKYADKINVNGTTFGSMFPKPDIDKLIEAGLPIDRVAALKSVYDNAKHEFERSKKHRGKERALRETVFYAVFAKGILSGNEDFELHHEGLVFTEVGVKLVKANIALYQAVFDRLGVEYIKTDLSAYAITPLTEETKKKLNLKSLNEHNGKMQESLAKRKGTEPPVYKDGDLINFIGEKYYNPKDQFETLEEAIDTMVERIGKEVKVGEEIKHTPILYWNVDALGRKDYSKIFIGIKVHGHGIVKLMEFKSSNEANSWIDEHDADFQQMAAAKIEQLKSDKSKPLPKYRIDNIYVRDNNGSIVRYDVYADFGKGIMRPLKSFDIPAKETSQERLRAQSEVYKNEVLPYMNSEEAKQSADEHARRIQQEKESKNRNYTTERKSRERVGRDWRNGKDATPDMFVDMDGNKSVFGFRAVEFGNYVTNKERQQFLNDIYDALMDMSDVLGVSPRALSLGGQLAIAVGARGKSSASGHYEPEKNVINLTKTSGYGILAHEWLHAFDRYFSNYNPSAIYVGGVQYATSEEYKDDMRQEVKDAFAALMDVIKKSDYYKRSMMLGEYWSSDKELAARALQDHIIRKLNERGQKNEFLSNLTATEDWDGEAENYPFPLGEESERIGEAIDNLFSVIDEKVDEKGNTVMYQKGELVMDAESEAFRRATERTMKQLESIGIDVEIVEDGTIVDNTAEKQIIENYNEKFNRELQQQIDGTLPKGHIYQLGMSGVKLQSAGIPYLPIELAASRLSDKSMQENHPFELSEIEGLVEAVQNPLAVFRSATRLGSFVVLTEIQHEDKNYVAAIQVNRKMGKVEVNTIRSIYPKDGAQIANWIEDGLSEYVDKEKMSEWISKQRSNSADVRNLFRRAAKIIQKFENRAIRPNFSRSAGIFYSNAKKAVLDIKQDKATPEQWLKMIEKNGGLKASEDRWLGLSDWLKTQQKRKNIDVQYAKEYDGEAKQIAHGIKEGDNSSIDLAAIEMAKLVKDGDILIPIPSRTGKATTSLALANRIAELAGKGKVADVLTGKERESLYNIKKEGKELPKASELEFVLKNQDVLNGNNRVVFVDNVMGTGTTLEAAVELIPNATALVYAKDNSTLSDKKTLTKDEILNFINENSIQIEEVEYEENPSSFDELKDEYERLLREEGYDYAQEVMRDRYGDDFDIAFADMGGELVIDNEEAAATLLGSNNIINSTRLQYTTEGLDNKKEIALVVPTIESYNSHDEIHFGDAGDGRAVAWVRFGETTDSDGKRVLVIDEIQSKRHQDGREKGYRNDKVLTARLDALKESAANVGMTFNADVRGRSLQFLDMEGNPIGTITRKPTDEQSEIMAQVRNVLFTNDGVPSAPFEKNWQELAMKRMLRYAAENGFDKVAWTTGEQQAERYSLSKAVKKTTVSVMSDNTRMVTLDFRHDEGYMDFKQMRVDEKGTIIGGDFTGSQLSDIVGKEFAIKIMGVEAERETFTDNDLRIGGEGMKGFYDNMLPAFVNKYGKKWGAKVGEVSLPKIGDDGLTMHSVDVTPQMKEDVMKGQPMFHKGQMSFDFLNQQDTPLSDTRLRKLEEGETSKIERIFTENKNFDFTSGEKIESIDDVAFIFKQLEDESIENSFAVLVKDGKPTVIHLGMGSYTATGLNGSALNVAVERIQPDKIYFIHNHPSGNLTASRQDIELLNRLKSTYGDIFEDGIIINLRSGKFATFNAEEKNIHDEKNIDNAVPVKVYSFNKQVFEKNYDPAETFKIRSSSDVAKFISSHRLGERPKLGILVCNNQLGVVGNVFTPYTKVTKENAKDIAKDIVYYTTSMGGTCAMMFGNANIYEVGSKRISQHVEDISTGSIKLMDYLNMQKDGSYWSASDEGVSFMRTSSGTIYGWTVNGRIYLTKDGINPNTPVHEYSHLWAEALMKNNPVLWSRIVNGLKDTPVWNEVMLDEEYSSIHHNDNLVASEVLSRLSGTENYRRTMEEAQREIESEKGIFAKAEKITIWERVKQALKDFWNWVVKTYGTNNITPEEAVNMTLNDFWNGVKPKGARSVEAASDIANAEEDDVLYREDEYKTEKIFGGIWIDNKQEFAKFVSAVENYVFEENGEGIAYTDNHFYAYYWNIDGEPIPYVDVYLNAEESQDVIKKIQKQNEKRRVHIGIRGYIDRAIVRAGSSNGKDNGNHGNNTSIPHRAGNDKLGGNILRKGRYFDNPSLYVKTQRADRYNRDGINSTVSSSPTRAQRRQMVEHAENLAKRLHLDNIEIVNSVSGLEGKKKSAKGFYDPKTGKITIVIPNNTSIADIEKTLLHEAVAHYGLRQLFGEHFDTFLDNVYNNADESIRKRIAELAIRKYNYDFRKATEEYLASLAERTNFENAQQSSWWQKVKDFFADMLSKLGFKDFRGVTITDNELRYVLWRSYENLKEKKNDNIFSQASDIAKQYELGVGDYAKSSESEDDVLFRDGDDYEKALAREQYERRLRTGWYQTQEALQDSMLGLKEAMSAILEDDVNIEDIDGFENAYLGENRLSSVNKAEADAFAHILFKPMLDEVAKLSHNSEERETLTDYMMAKHGLERNEYMRQQAIQNGEDANRDFAGLTSLTGFDDITAAEAEAKRMVDEYEQDHDTTELWDKVNAVSNAILQKSYECGLIDKDTFENISNMYEFYIPLRGFEEKTSEEAYAYLTHSHSVFNAPIKKTQGRKSKADDPFANLQSMAESAIMQGNRNRLVKQRFLNFVINHPSDLVSVSELWIEHDDVTDEWKPVFPDNLNDNDTPEEIEQKFKDFEDKMQSLTQQYPDKYKHGRDAIGIPYRIVNSRDLSQHQVIVKRGGRDIILTVNGNPRLAQALNGQTNPDNDMSGAIGAILRSGEWVNRQLSAFYTTRNPDFIVSNFVRDMFYTNTMAWIKESPNYALRFHKNYIMANPVAMKRLLNKYRKGTLDRSDKTESMFYQFMMNGGETGYSNIRDIEQHKNDIRKELKKANGRIKIGRALSLLAERFDELNRSVENCARFAAFVTSREMGRTVDRSVYDAKEISVNFNKKGSGAKFYGSVGQTFSGNASALASGLGRSGFVFWNAAIQGTTNFGRQIKRHPAKAFTGIASMFLLGALVAFLGGDDDDDDNKNSYYNLPEYVRRSNILFRAGEQWISIPLPIEYRAFYGMGELMTSVMNGKEHMTDGEIAEAIAGQVSQILPIDFLEGGGGLNAFVPSAVKPLWEAYVIEKGWTGMPIYKDTPYNKNMPEWTKAYSSANKHIVNLAASLNEATGGDRYTKGSIDINPAKIEYMLNGYFGGVFSTINKLSKTAETISGSREYDPRNILLLNRVVKAGDERTEYRAVNNEYFRLKEEHDQLKMRLGKYENDTYNGIFDYAEKIDFLYNSPEYQRYEIFEFYNKEIKSLNDMIKNTYDNDERKELESYLNELKKEMIEEINKTRQTRKGA